MRWVFSETKQQYSLAPLPNPYVLSQPPPANPESDGMDISSKVSPGILLVIIILAIIFFVSGLLHLLFRILSRPNYRDREDLDNATALQGQLQQLFHLHDSGVDQTYIDTLPVFNYKAIIGLKKPFDCAVCLCEFEPEDKLRLLPKCSHAFHIECIDTWLLSHSTCPLCRCSLIPDLSEDSGRSAVVLVLESESSREILSDIESNTLGARTNSHLGTSREEDLGSTRIEISRKSSEILEKLEESPPPAPAVTMAGPEEKVVPVKLGKFRCVNGGSEESSENDGKDARRCFSMGSFQYVMEENSSLQVPIRTPAKKQHSRKKPSLPLTPGLKPAMSECDCESVREFDCFEPVGNGVGKSSCGGSARFGRSRKDSFSISKIWLRGKKEGKQPDPAAAAEGSSRRAFSFRFPMHRSAAAAATAAAAEETKTKGGGVESGRRAVSEIEFGRWESWRSGELEGQAARVPSFPNWRTLLWLVGRQSKVVHSSSSPNA